MINKLFLSLVLFLVFIVSSQEAQSKTYAWLIDLRGKVQKLDVDANKIIQKVELKGNPRVSVSLQETDDAVVADTASNLLVFVNDYGRIGQWIGVYNLKDLSFRKKLELESRDPHLMLPKIIIPPTGNKFYVTWWDGRKEVNLRGGETYSVYDKTTLNKIIDLTSMPINVYKPWRFSTDSKKLYTINIDENEIKVYDDNTLQLLESISLATVWGAPLFGKSLEYFNNDKTLLAENLKSTESDPNNIMYFVYNTRVSSELISSP